MALIERVLMPPEDYAQMIVNTRGIEHAYESCIEAARTHTLVPQAYMAEVLESIHQLIEDHRNSL